MKTLIKYEPGARYAMGQLTRKAYAYAKVARTARRYRKRTVIKKKPLPRTQRQNVRVQGVGGQISYFSRKNKTSKRVLDFIKNHANNTLFWNDSVRVTSNAGCQSIQTYGNFTCGTWSATQSTDNDLAYIQYVVGGDATTTGPNRTVRFLLKSVKSSFKMTNQDNSNTEVIIYDILTRRDSNIGVNTAFVDGINQQATGAYTTANLPPGVSPWDSQEFNAYYRIAKKTRIILGAGQSHTHLVSLTPRYMFSSSLQADSNKSIKNLTHYTMISVSGMPYNDKTTVTNVATGTCVLDVVWSKQLSYTWSDDMRSNTYITNNLLGKITTEHVMETDGDVVDGTSA